jgi:hypothetical protein
MMTTAIKLVVAPPIRLLPIPATLAAPQPVAARVIPRAIFHRGVLRSFRLMPIAMASTTPQVKPIYKRETRAFADSRTPFNLNT